MTQARGYAGSEGYYGDVWRSRPDLREGIFQASKSASRLHADAEMDLQETLQRLGVETLDSRQIHDVRTFSDLRDVEGPSGALEAFVEAKEMGIVRHIGVTGHHDPDVLSHAVENWPIDAVMMPINPVEGGSGGFLDTTLKVAEEQDVAVIGMKVLGGASYIVTDAGVTPEVLIRYALAQKISVAIVGCSTPGRYRPLRRLRGQGHSLMMKWKHSSRRSAPTLGTWHITGVLFSTPRHSRSERFPPSPSTAPIDCDPRTFSRLY